MYGPILFKMIFTVLIILIFLKRDVNDIYIGSTCTYTALGDSIAFGSGATNRYGYVYRFYDYLRVRVGNVKLKNLSFLGRTSSGLLKQLQTNIETWHAVKYAKIITISIGGNNLLKSAWGNYTMIDEKIALAGVEKFCDDWSKILHCIRKQIGSRAKIYVMTLYNPFRIEDPNYDAANRFITRINNCIADPELIALYKYVVVDVYSLFESNPDKDWTKFTQSLRNPHPNDEGHHQIALLHEKVYETL